VNLEQLNIAIRPRRDWEAVDLGLLMSHRWWWQMQQVWLLLTLPWLLASWVVPVDYLGLVILSLWWLKPLFERPLLMILSQGVFGARLSTREVLRAFWRLALAQPLLSLTWRRFSPHRSMDLPVIQLEGLAGTERRDRLTVLHRDDSGPAVWITLLGHSLECMIGLACAMLLGVFIPDEVNFDYWSWEFWLEGRPGPMLMVLFAYIALAILAPLYTACGFSLYLNRRVKLEGWDLEIAFKHMAQKRGLLALILAAAIGSLSLVEQPAHADTASERQAIHEQIIRIKEGPDFHRMETQKVLKQSEAKKKPEQKDDDSLDWLWQKLRNLAELLAGMAGVLELLLWAAVLALILVVALKYGSWLERFPGFSSLRRGRHYQPQTLFGMEVTQDSLPDDVSQAALTLWQDGEQRAALALLYRASLAQLLERGVPLKEGSTEQECLHLAQGMEQELQLPALSLGYFAQLTAAWRRLAYGHRPPAEQHGQELCSQWQKSWPEVRYD
jgi:hypothetical protein